MREFGTILVKLKNIENTGKFFGINVYNDFFIRVKDDYFMPLTYFVDDIVDKKSFILNDRNSMLNLNHFLNNISNVVHSKISDYYKNRQYLKVLKVITPRITPLTGMMLGMLNLLKKSNIPESQKRLYDVPLITSDKVCGIDPYTIAYKMKTLIKTLPLYRIAPSTDKKMGLSVMLINNALQKLENGQQSNWMISTSLPEINSVKQFSKITSANLEKEPLYSDFSINNFMGDYYITVINGNGAVYFKPILSRYIIKGTFKLNDAKKVNIYSADTVLRMHNEFREHASDTVAFQYGNSVQNVLAVNPELNNIYINTYKGFVISAPVSMFKCYSKSCSIKSKMGTIRFNGFSPLTTIANTVITIKHYKNCAKFDIIY